MCTYICFLISMWFLIFFMICSAFLFQRDFWHFFMICSAFLFQCDFRYVSIILLGFLISMWFLFFLHDFAKLSYFNVIFLMLSMILLGVLISMWFFKGVIRSGDFMEALLYMQYWKFIKWVCHLSSKANYTKKLVYKMSLPTNMMVGSWKCSSLWNEFQQKQTSYKM